MKPEVPPTWLNSRVPPPTIGSLGYSNPLGVIHNGAFRVKCTLVHHLGCKKTFTKVEQMKWHLKNRDHKRFPCFSCESTLAFHTGGALVDHVLCTPHHDDELNMRRHGKKYRKAKKKRLDAIQQQQIGLNRSSSSLAAAPKMPSSSPSLLPSSSASSASSPSWPLLERKGREASVRECPRNLSKKSADFP